MPSSVPIFFLTFCIVLKFKSALLRRRAGLVGMGSECWVRSRKDIIRIPLQYPWVPFWSMLLLYLFSLLVLLLVLILLLAAFIACFCCFFFFSFSSLLVSRPLVFLAANQQQQPASLSVAPLIIFLPVAKLISLPHPFQQVISLATYLLFLNSSECILKIIPVNRFSQKRFINTAGSGVTR